MKLLVPKIFILFLFRFSMCYGASFVIKCEKCNTCSSTQNCLTIASSNSKYSFQKCTQTCSGFTQLSFTTNSCQTDDFRLPCSSSCCFSTVTQICSPFTCSSQLTKAITCGSCTNTPNCPDGCYKVNAGGQIIETCLSTLNFTVCPTYKSCSKDMFGQTCSTSCCMTVPSDKGSCSTRYESIIASGEISKICNQNSTVVIETKFESHSSFIVSVMLLIASLMI